MPSRLQTTSMDPMQAELTGLSLAIRPGRAAYVPLSHKTGQGDLLGGGLAPNQISVRDALTLLKPLLQDKSVLKIVQNVKYDLVVMSRYGIEIAPYDDTMLISYVLEAGANGSHDIEALAERWLGHKTLDIKELTGSGKIRHHLRLRRY